MDMKIRSKVEWKKHESFLNKELDILRKFVKGKLDVKTFLKKRDRVGKQALSLASATFNSFGDFERTMRTYPLSTLDNLERRIHHEREHAEVREKYGVDYVYAIIIWGEKVQPYIQDFLYQKAKNWSKRQVIEFLKECELTGTRDTELGKRDIEVVNILSSYKE